MRLYTIKLCDTLLGKTMGTIFSRKYYDSICQYLFADSKDLSAGLDRVTADNFMKHVSENYDIIKRKMGNCSYHFTRFKEVDTGKRVIYIPTCRDKVVLEYLKLVLKHNYSISMKSRNEISRNLVSILSEKMDYYVIRLDVKHFFDNIDHNVLLNKIKKDSLFSVEEYALIRNLLNSFGNSGVPQGVGLSNYLSEIYMKTFDLEMSRILPKTFYYERYVDDIILIIPGIPNDIEKARIDETIESIFSNNKLIKNSTKCQSIVFYKDNNDGIDYLGYHYKKVKNNLIVGISESKMTEIKNKVDFMMKDYNKNSCFALLEERLKDLTMVHGIFKAKHYLKKDHSVGYKRMKCFFGTKYDYQFAGDDDFIILNKYIKGWIHRLTKLTRKQRRQLFGVLYSVDESEARYYNPYKKKISQYRSLIYAMSDSGLIGAGWAELMRMDKIGLSKEYQRMIKGAM